jgi:WD40 repeat protein
MVRFFVGVLVAVAIVVGVALWFGLSIDQPPGETRPRSSHHAGGPHPEYGPELYASVKLAPLPPAPAKQAYTIPIEPCLVVVREKQEVSSPKDGHLLFVGQDVTGLQNVQEVPGRRVRTIEVFDGKEVKERKYRPLEEGDFVEFEQVVAVIDPALAINDLAGKETKLIAARADHVASKDILVESKKRWERLKDLQRQGKQIVTDEEFGTAQVTYYKYLGEEVTKAQAILLADAEKAQANLILTQHFLKSKLPGKSIVKKIYKYSGEGIKAQEPILQLNNISRLRVEGSAGSQFLPLVRAGMECYLEPSVEMAPRQPLINAHRAEVNSVATCADGEHFVSGSEDKTVCIWQRGHTAPLYQLYHSSPVRVVACNPKNHTMLAGCADGTIVLWDLSKNPPVKQALEVHHRGAVSALAFSPDGQFFASGGEDNSIVMWKSGGEKLYTFDSEDGHQGTITALNFTPQCKLVSAARDNTLRIWSLYQKGAEAGGVIANRGGNVNQLGVSTDGRYVLFDQGRTLQLIDSTTGLTVAALNNLAGANPFDTLALFSPDGQLMLTGGAGEGRLSLWKTPTPEDRGYQVRELVTSTKERSAINTAAFGPAGKHFAVTGSKDGYVHLWALPDAEAVKNHRIFVDANGDPLHLDLVEQALDGNKTRVVVNVQNPQDEQHQERLLPGQRVTVVVMVAPPK